MGERLSKAELQKIIKKEKPGFIVLDLPEDDAPIRDGIDRTPELAELNRMWGVDGSYVNEGVHIVTIPDRSVNGPGPKIQAIKNGEIVAYQG